MIKKEITKESAWDKAWYKRKRCGCVLHPGNQWRVNNQGRPTLLDQLTQSDMWFQLLNGEAESGRRSLIGLFNCNTDGRKQHWKYEPLELRFPHVPHTSVHAVSLNCRLVTSVFTHTDEQHATVRAEFLTIWEPLDHYSAHVENWGLAIFLLENTDAASVPFAGTFSALNTKYKPNQLLSKGLIFTLKL